MINMEDKIVKKIFKDFCKETGRSGGILCHNSITEWHIYLSKRLEKLFKL